MEVEEPLDEKRVRLHKRIRDASTSCEQALYNNVLGELGPLGLHPRKSRSLADMIQMMLSQANAVGRMVLSSDSGKCQADSTQHSTPPPPAVKLEVVESFDEKRVCLHKRIRDASTSCEQALYNNVLGELGPLGLRPRKSRSLADMIQMMLSQANAESPYFNPQYSVLDDQSDSKSHINDFIKDDSRTTFSDFYEPGPPCATSSISNKTETRDSFGRTLDFDSQDTTSPSSVEELASGNTSLSCDALFDKEITDFIPQFFDNDSQSSAASDEQSIISRGNSLCCLLQQNTVGGMVWSSDSGKRRAVSTQHSTPPPPAVKLEVEEPLDEKHVRLHKRIRDASTSCEQDLYNNVLG
ncbi:hypothetical protein ZIOFF_013447 [Zingiber officinale]|uniref:Uncharacterized protein n=1 Tax=Zingiber officinale TaxID=94328 RepID=A0A8J5HFU8_ZINOF|nr:hypothetical protein ZIOFF_013447 [Zingiber officinale]